MAPAGTATVTRFRQPIARASSVTSGTSTPAPKSESSLSVQFTTAHDEDDESDTKRSFSEVSDDDEDANHRPNLIENVYGVETRKHQPIKKIKSEHGSEQESNITKAPVSISGDSGLGKWVKEGEQSTPIPSASDVVDLTTGMGL